MASFARWCYRHRLIVVIAWIVILATVVGVDRTVGNAYSNSFTLPGTESAKALALLSTALPAQSGDSDRSSGTCRRFGRRPGRARRITALLQLVAKSKSVAGVRSPYTRPAPPRSAATARPPSPPYFKSSPRRCPKPTSSTSSR